MSSRRVFDESYKRAAVHRVESCQTVESVAEELGISVGLLYRWRRGYASLSSTKSKSLTELMEEFRQIRKLVERIELEALTAKCDVNLR